jgi:hypothetical protein
LVGDKDTQAVADYEQAFAAAERGKDLMWQAMASNHIAYHALLLGERIKAQEWLQRGLAIYFNHALPSATDASIILPRLQGSNGSATFSLAA